MPASQTQSQNSSRQARFIALALGIPIFLLLIALMAMPFLAQEETPLQAVGPVPAEAGSEQGGVRFNGTIHVWDVVGRVALDAQRTAHVSFDLRGPDSHPPSGILDIPIEFQMPEHNMDTIRAQAEPVGVGAYATELDLPMPGTWLMRMEINDEIGVLRLQVDE